MIGRGSNSGRVSAGSSQSGAIQLATVASLILLLLVGVGSAFASDSTTEPASAVGLLGQALEQGDPVETALTDPQASRELPHHDLTREEAVELTEAVFEPLLDNAAGPLQDLEVEKYLGESAAIVPASDSGQGAVVVGPEASEEPPVGQSVLLESTLPLRTEGPDGNLEPVDLSLERVGGKLEPQAPLVDVKIPQALGDGVELPGANLGVELVGAPEDLAPTLINGTVASYPNVASDTDLSVVATPTGLETMTTLRTAAAPHEQALRIDLPPGATLHQTETGGAAVMREGKTLVNIPAPTAIDANGQGVPVALSVDGDEISLSVSSLETTVYPVLVDPIFESYDWYWFSPAQTGQNTWHGSSNAAGMETSAQVNGLFLTARAEGFQYKNGSLANFLYYVPRLKQDEAQGRTPRSFLQKMTLWHMAFATEPGGSFAPYLFAGILGASGWVGKPGGYAVWGYPGNFGPFYMNAPGNGMLVELINGEPTKRDTTAKMGEVGLLSEESVSIPNRRIAAVGAASVEVADEDLPKAANGSISPWVDQTATAPLTATAEDEGLGVKRIGFTVPGQGLKVATNSCLGTAENPCPYSWQGSIAAGEYNPAAMPQGFDYVPLAAEDVVGNISVTTEKALVKVDHTKPQLGLSGSLTETATLGGKLPSYQLNLAASDGDTVTAEMTATVGTSGTGTGQLERPQGVAVDPAGNVWVADKTNNRVVEYDKNGAYVRQIGTGTGNGQIKEPRGITATSAGNIWVAEFAPNKRLQEFNGKGEFIRKVTHEKIIEPWGIAAGPNGTIWVADQGSHKLLQFKEDGTYLRSNKESGGGGGSLTWPIGVAVDAKGNVWTADESTNKVSEYNAEGTFIFSFGGTGSGNGQLSAPQGIAIAPSGNVLVVDAGNSRVQEFKPDGTYLRQFGTSGSGSGQFKEPRGIAVGSGNTALVADAGNHRIARWSHADQDFQSGVVATTIKVDGKVESELAPGCATNSCAVSRSWTLESGKYTTGQHEVEVIATDGVNLSTSEKLKVELQPDLTAPSLTVSGSITEQATLGSSRPRYKLKIQASDPTAIANTEVWVDGSPVDSGPGCAGANCAAVREWTLNADAYAAGKHTVVSRATDGFGNTNTKTTKIEIQRDTTKPTITAGGALYNAPSGWVEQGSYGFTASATDAGYGVTSLALKIDGTQVAGSSASCADGGCEASVQKTINTATYAGGDHPAEVIASDGAGNTSVQKWTINVDPSGGISASEVNETIEAVEGTEPETFAVAPTDEVISEGERAEGNDPGLESIGGGDYTSIGTPVESTILTGSDEGLVVGAPGGDIEITPVTPPTSAEAKVVENVAAILPSTAKGTDTIVRPKYNGLLAFQTIREPTSPEQFSWEVVLQPGQELKAFEGGVSAGVFFEDGTQMMLINAMPAHDATGKYVPTHLTVTSPNIVTLTVEHKKATYSYPILTGPGFEVGYSTVRVEYPPASEEEEQLEAGGVVVSAPHPILGSKNASDDEATTSQAPQKFWVEFEVPAAGCSPIACIPRYWEIVMKGIFRGNFHSVWWSNKDEPPRCPPWTNLNVSLDIEYCGWVGQNHQPYGHGYHITDQARFTVTKSAGPVSKQNYRAVSVNLYGDGHVSDAQYTDCICNPLPGSH